MIGIKSKLNSLALTPAFLLCAFLGHIDTAWAQNSLSFSPALPVTLTTQINVNPAPFTEFVTLNNLPVTSLSVSSVTTAAGQTGGWLAAPVVSVTPGQSSLQVYVSVMNLIPGTYNGTINIVANGISAALPVSLIVFTSTSFTASPASLAFNAQANGTQPASQIISLSTSTPNIAFSAVASTTSGSNWLSVSTSGNVTPANLSVTVNPAQLSAGTYNGTITITSAPLQPLTIPVTLTVTSQPTLSASPAGVTLLYQSGTNAAAPSQSIQIQTSSGSLAYTGSVTYSSTNPCGSNWLQIPTGLSGTAPSTLTVTTNLAGLVATQSCSATITLSSPGAGNPTLAIPVSLSISPNPQLGVNPSTLSFNYSLGSSLPPPQNLIVFTSNNTALNYSVTSTTPWLSLPATPANGFTSNMITVGLNQAAVQAMNQGTYNGSITISALGSGIAAVTVPVILSVSNNPLFVISPPFLNFNYQAGTVPPSPLSFNISTTAGQLPFALSSPSTTGNQYVLFSPFSGTATTTATPISISLNNAVLPTLAPGTYTTSVIVSGTGTSASVAQQILQVNIAVSSTPLVNVSPQSIIFPPYTVNSPVPNPTQVTLSSTDGITSLPVSITANQPWLAVTGLTSNTTPAQFSVGIAPFGLTPGNYSGVITVSSNSQVQSIPVSLTVVSGVAISVAPASLTFTQPAGGQAPATQSLMVNTTAGQALTFSANASTTSGGGWLTIGGSTGTVTGTAPQALTIGINAAGLQPGTYTGAITINANAASNPTLSVPVTLTVTSAQTLAANPASLTFTGAVSGASPATQTIAVTSTTGSPVAFTATAQPQGGNWLTVAPAAAATTPASVTVTANQAGLAAGSYTGTVTLTPTAAGSTPLIVNVMLTVGAQATPAVVTVINAASGSTGAVAPGEIISLFGTGLGPVTSAGTTLTSTGNVSTNIGNTQVFFDGIAAPLTYVQAGQINAVVPYEVIGRTTTQVTVNFNGVTSPATALQVVATAPGIFTQNGSGSGPGSIQNQNASLNSAGNPAARGSVVVIYATGEGQTSPPGITGSVIAPTLAALKNPVAPVSVTIGGQPAAVQYAGSAPNYVSGVLQLNVTVPSGVTPGAALPVVVQIGTVSSQANVTLAVQ